METLTFVLGMWPARQKTAFPASLPAKSSHVTTFWTMGWEQKRCIQFLSCVFKGQGYSSPLPPSILLLGIQMWWQAILAYKMRAQERHAKDSRITRHKEAWFLDNLAKHSCHISQVLHVPRFKSSLSDSKAMLFHLCSHITKTCILIRAAQSTLACVVIA